MSLISRSSDAMTWCIFLMEIPKREDLRQQIGDWCKWRKTSIRKSEKCSLKLIKLLWCKFQKENGLREVENGSHFNDVILPIWCRDAIKFDRKILIFTMPFIYNVSEFHIFICNVKEVVKNWNTPGYFGNLCVFRQGLT